MLKNDFELFIKELFTDNIYGLFLLYGFDLPILKNKKFPPPKLHSLHEDIFSSSVKEDIIDLIILTGEWSRAVEILCNKKQIYYGVINDIPKARNIIIPSIAKILCP